MKRMLSLILAVSMMVTQYPISTFAAPQNTIEGETTEITADQNDFQIEDGTLIKYLGEGGEVVIPEGVTAIGSSAFQNCTTLTKVTMSDSVEMIGINAFNGCTALEEVFFSDALISIGDNAFRECTSLKGIKFPTGLKTIGSYAFYQCTGMTGDLIIPDSVTSLGSYAFYQCTSLDGELKLSASLTSISDSTFYQCRKLTGDLIIPEGVTSIGSRAFCQCAGFNGRIELPDTLQRINYNAFDGCKNIVGELVIPDQVSSLPTEAFQNMSGITSIIFGEGFIQHGDSTFDGCTNVSEITFMNPEPAKINGSLYNPFSSMSKLETVYVPGESYSEYSAAYKSYLPATARFRSIGSTGDFQIDDGVLTAYFGEGGEVNIPEGVSIIGTSAFQNCTTLTKVTMPDSVISIGEYAFAGCSTLEEIEFSSSLVSIGSYAFQGCGALVRIEMPETLETISSNAFRECTSLEGIEFPTGLKTIGSNAFYQCTGMTGDLIIPDSVTFLGSYAFYQCTSLDGELKLSASLTSISDSTFYQCRKLTGDLIIPEGVTSIGSRAFCQCAGFNGRIELPDTLQRINYNAFDGCKNIVGELVIPDQVSSLPTEAFQNMSGITSIIFGEGFIQHGDSTFDGCTNVSEITFMNPEPAKINGSLYNPFSSMSKLETVYVPGESYSEYSAAYKSYLPATARFRSIGSTGDFQIDDGVLTAYFGEGGEVNIPEGVSIIGTSAFQNCTTLTKVTMPDSVISIGEYAFAGCSTLEEIEFSSSLVSIGSYAFQGCGALVRIEMPETLETISSNAFRECTSLEGIEFPTGLKTIGSNAFYQCTGMTGDLIIPDSVTFLGSYAFYQCTSLDGELKLSASLTSISDSTFYQCRKLTGDLIIPEGVTSIGSRAFCQCAGFNGRIELPDTLQRINYNAFDGCKNIVGELVIPDQVSSLPTEAFQNMSGITSIIFGEGFIQHGDSTFDGCTNVSEITFMNPEPAKINGSLYNPFSSMSKLETVYVPGESYSEYSAAYKSYLPATARFRSIGSTGDFQIDDGVLTAYFGEGGEVNIPEGVSIIGTSAFQNCTTLTKVTMPDSVISIGEYAFAGCSTLEEIEFSSSLVSIGSYAFQGCGALVRIEMPETLETISSNAFRECTSLEGIEFPTGLKTIGSNAFYQCTGMTGDLIIPDSVTFLGSYAFYQCTSLDGELKLSASLTSISDSTFYQCRKLTGDLIIPEGVTSIGSRAFCQCAGFNGRIELPDTLQRINYNAFDGCKNIVGELVIPDQVSSLPTEAFQNMSGITSIIFGEGFIQHGDSTFDGCTNVSEITFMNPEPAKINGSLYNPFSSMSKLETVYVPGESYSEYSAAYKSYLPATARFRSIGSTGDFQIDDGVLTAYFGEGGEVNIPEGVSIIGTSAFQNCTTLTKVTMPDSVISIGEYAFAGCSTLEEIEFSSSLVSIGSYAFQGCGALVRIEMPETLETISSNAFRECTSLEGIEFPTGLKTIGSNAFYQCTGMTGDLIIPDSVTFLGSYAFYQCTSLDGELKLSASLTSISDSTFYQCRKLTGDLIIPEGVTSIGSRAFCQCAGFNGRIELPDTLQRINYNAFDGCKNIVGELVIPDQVSSLPTEAFQNMSGITSIIFGEGFIQHGDSTFDGCTNVSEITFMNPEPAKINGSLYNPFSSMSKLETVYVPGESYSEYSAAYKSYLPATARFRSIGSTGDFQIDDGVLTAYFGEGGEVNIPEGVSIIGTSAFQNCTTLTKVTMPDSVISIGEYAFAGCSTLEEIEFSSSLVSIGSYAFQGCGALVRIEMPETLETISSNAFRECTSLEGIEFPTGLKTIGSNAFYQCTGMTGDLIIPDSVTFLGSYAFYQCTSLDGELKLSASLTSISDSTFYQCRKLTGDLIIPEGVTSIGSRAFCQCAGFNGRIELPDTLQRINYNAFDGCKNIVGELVIPDQVSSLPTEAFQNMSGITSIIFGEGFIQHGDSTFDGCTNVSEITFMNPEPAKINGSLYNPFSSMSKLETVYVPGESYDAYVSAYSKYVGDSVQFSSDYLNPRVPNFDISQLYSHSVVLKWSAHLNDQVIGYIVYRDGEEIGRTTELTYTDRNLETNQTYQYTVRGYTENGDLTGAGEISVTPKNPEVISIETGHSLNKVSDENSTLTIVMDNYDNHEPFEGKTNSAKLYYVVDHERLYLGDAQFRYISGKYATYTFNWDITAFEDGEYVLVFVFEDVDGAVTEMRKTVSIDRSRPEKIVSVSAISGVNGIFLSWAISGEVDTETYRIYRRAAGEEQYRLLKEISGRDILAYTDTSVEADQTYYYYVVGVNEFGREGEPSDVVGATLADDTEAPVVTKITPANSSYLSGQVNFTVSAQDNVSVTKTALFYSIDDGESWKLIGEANASGKIQFDSTQLADGEVRIKGVAYDAVGNESSALTYVYSIDNTGPSKVENLAYESTSVTITLSWDNVSDEDIRYYRVERRNEDGTYTKVSDVYNTLGYNLYDLIPSSEYVYRVVGYDHLGNRGIPSDDMKALTKEDDTAPVITKIRPLSGYYSGQIDIRITAEDEYNVASLTLQVSRDGARWEDIYTETYENISKARTMTYLLGLGEYEEGALYVRGIAMDTAENISDTSNEAPYVQHMVDKTSPEPPAGVKAEGHSGYIEISGNREQRRI